MPYESLDELELPIQRLVQKASGIQQIIPANRGHSPPEPHGSLYGTYNIIPVKAYGQVRREWTDEEEQATISSMELLVSCNFFNSGARDCAMRFYNASHRNPVYRHLYENGMAWRQASNARNLTTEEQGVIQQRYQVDLDLFVETMIRDTMLVARSVDIIIYNEDGQWLTQSNG